MVPKSRERLQKNSNRIGTQRLTPFEPEQALHGALRDAFPGTMWLPHLVGFY
jgi:hypothetical protein